MFTNNERSRYLYLLKIFPFSLKGDAKIWFNSLDPGCVRSPQDMIYYFSAKYFPAHKKQAALAILACKDRYELKRLLAKWKQQSLTARMKPDPAFATSPICVTDKDYEFSVDPEIITLVESDPFYGLESETVVAHLTKLNDIATLLTNDEKSRY